MQKKLPIFLKQYFWDVDFNKIDPEKSRIFVLKRILDRGNDKALKWMLKHYTKGDIRQLLLTTRDLSAKTANYWADLLDVDKRKVVCLQKPYSRIQFGLSS